MSIFQTPSFARVKKFVFSSPYFFLLFLLIPALIVGARYLPILRLIPITTRVILANNLILLFFIAQRFLRCLAGVRRNIRYGNDTGVPRNGILTALTAGEWRAKLSANGYNFDESGRYGEKRDIGYFGTALFYGGVFFLLSVGTWENLNQFSGTILQGVGVPSPLNVKKTYGKVISGPLTSIQSLPRLQIKKQIMPNEEYPQGATEIALITKEGTELSRGMIEPYRPMHYRNYDINLARFMFDASIKVTTNKNQYVFSDFIKLQPMARKKGIYSHYGVFDTEKYHGDVYYEPEKKQAQVVLKKEGQVKLDAEMVFQKDHQKAQGEYIVEIDKLAQWSEIHVSRRRHMNLVVLGGIVAALGGLLRLLVRPQRVWLEETDGGRCRVKAVGKEAKNWLKAE